MQKKYVVRLTDQERNELQRVIKKLKGTSEKVRRAQILLKTDADGLNWTDAQIAENELSSLTRQCVAGRRFADAATLREETAAWSTDVNETQRGVDWQMKIDDARCKLTSIYPKIKL